MSTTVAVIGDSCLDAFHYCSAVRLAPDVPIPVLVVERTVESPGMTMNVAENLRRLGRSPLLVTNANWRQLRKDRYVHGASNHAFFRVDREVSAEPIDLQGLPVRVDLAVVSDYDKGALDMAAMARIREISELLVLDTKKRLGPWAYLADFIKINDYEFRRSQDRIDAKLAPRIIRTMGGDGAAFRDERFPVEAVDVRDTTGAGDAFLASFVHRYLECQDPRESIRFANAQASGVVKHRGVSQVDS